MMSKMKCFGALAGCALATGALYATTTYSETFEGTPDLTKWSGGTVTESNYTYSAVSTAGFPLSNSLPEHNNVLVIEGNTEYAHGSAIGSGGAPLVDMMVQTARPDDELGFPSSETTGTIQIAVAVDSNGCFNAYCQKKDNTVGWCKLSNTQYDATGWARVSFLFDYTNTPKRCQIRINGEPVMSDFGYLTASTSDGTKAGAWYNLANAGSGVSSMKVIGCTAIDEVALYADSATYPLAGVSDASGVPYAWYDQYGISWDASGEYDTSGMTAAEKFNACLSPFDGQKFEIKSVGVKDVSGTKKVTVAVPMPDAMRADRQLVVEYSTDSSFATSSTEPVPANATSVDITAPAGGSTVYYRLKAVDK
ncbi:MAG: hypothetical protein IJL17_01845 [Kiritimatiellae bacterium]|nr:hypothetical protein [Kiritimatiellia bacterium]